MVFRTVLPGLALLVLAGVPHGADARPQPGPAEQRQEPRPPKLTPNRWVAAVVTRITQAGETAEADAPGGSVAIRIRIGADGTLEGAAIEESSGVPALDDRALRAAKAASPFAPPPDKLLTLEGFTELSFAVEFAKSAGR